MIDWQDSCLSMYLPADISSVRLHIQQCLICKSDGTTFIFLGRGVTAIHPKLDEFFTECSVICTLYIHRHAGVLAMMATRQIFLAHAVWTLMSVSLTLDHVTLPVKIALAPSAAPVQR